MYSVYPSLLVLVLLLPPFLSGHWHIVTDLSSWTARVVFLTVVNPEPRGWCTSHIMYLVFLCLLVLALLLPPFLSGHWHIVGFVYIIICVLSSDERLLVVHTELSPAELYTPLSAGRGQHDLHKRLVIRALLRVCVQGTQNGDCLVVLILRHELSIHLKSVCTV